MELGVDCLSLCFVDTPGFEDQGGSAQDAENWSTIVEANVSELRGRFPSTVLIVWSAADPRIGGSQTDLARFLQALGNLDVIDVHQPNVLLVLTHGSELFQGHFKKEADRMKHLEIYRKQIKAFLPIHAVDIVLLENNLDLVAPVPKSDFTKFPDGKMQPYNLFQSITRLCRVDPVAAEAVRLGFQGKPPLSAASSETITWLGPYTAATIHEVDDLRPERAFFGSCIHPTDIRLIPTTAIVLDASAASTPASKAAGLASIFGQGFFQDQVAPKPVFLTTPAKRPSPGGPYQAVNFPSNVNVVPCRVRRLDFALVAREEAWLEAAQAALQLPSSPQVTALAGAKLETLCHVHRWSLDTESTSEDLEFSYSFSLTAARVILDLDNTVKHLAPEFRAAVEALPSGCGSAAEAEQWSSFFAAFGSHVVQEVAYGGRLSGHVCPSDISRQIRTTQESEELLRGVLWRGLYGNYQKEVENAPLAKVAKDCFTAVPELALEGGNASFQSTLNAATISLESMLAWQESVQKEPIFLVERTRVVPIWEVIRELDPKRAEAGEMAYQSLAPPVRTAAEPVKGLAVQPTMLKRVTTAIRRGHEVVKNIDFSWFTPGAAAPTGPTSPTSAAAPPMPSSPPATRTTPPPKPPPKPPRQQAKAVNDELTGEGAPSLHHHPGLDLSSSLTVHPPVEVDPLTRDEATEQARPRGGIGCLMM
jgi:hypothetical protein